MAQLITENCFKLSKNTQLEKLIDCRDTEEDWLNALCQQLNHQSSSMNYPPVGDWLWHRCHKLDETHPVLMVLNKFYNALSQHFFSNYSLQMTLTLLKDWNNECFEGLVNIIEASFYFSGVVQNLLDYLQHRRIEIIKLTFNQTGTDNNHTHNRLFTIAAVNGYGVEAINANDKYPGILSDQLIQTLLKESFEQHYRPLELVFSLLDKFKTDAKLSYSYNGKYSLKADVVHDFLLYLQVFFQDTSTLSVYEFCEINPLDFSFIDYNWPAIGLYIFNRLIELDMFICNPTHRDLIAHFLNPKHELSEVNLMLLFDDKLISSPLHLNHFLEIIHPKHTELHKIIINHYVQYLISNNHPDLLQAINLYSPMDNFFQQLLDKECLTPNTIFHQFSLKRQLAVDQVECLFSNCSEDFLKDLLLLKDSQERHILILCAMHHPKLIPYILSQITRLNLLSSVLTEVDRDCNNVLLALLSHHHSHTERLLNDLRLINTSDETLISLLETPNIFGQNSLMVCVNQHPSLLKYMLNLIDNLAIENKRKFKLFSHTNTEGNHALMLACNEHVSTLHLLMQSLNRLKLSANHYKQLFTQKNQFQQNMLYLVASTGTIYFLPILQKINQLNITCAEKISLLTTISFQNRNCLFHLDINQYQMAHQEIRCLSPSTAKLFCNAVLSRMYMLSNDIRKELNELLIEVELERLKMVIGEQSLSNPSLPPTLGIKFHAKLSMHQLSFKRSEKTDLDIFKYAKECYEILTEPTYSEITSTPSCCFYFFQKSNDYEEIVDHLKQLFDYYLRAIEYDLQKNQLSL